VVQVLPDGHPAQRQRPAGPRRVHPLLLRPVLYILGDDGWERLFGKTAAGDRLTWTKYKEVMFDQLRRSQNGDGSWAGGGGFSVGPVYSTAIYCVILQLDKGSLPIWQR